MSDSVEHGCKMKRIHEQGCSYELSQSQGGSPWEAKTLPVMMGAHSCNHQIEKAFHFLNFQLVNKSSQNTQWRETIAM